MIKITTRKILFLTVSVCIILILGFCAAIIIRKHSTRKTIGRLNAGYKVLNTINTYFVPGKNVTLSGKPVEERGLYKVDLVLDNVTQSFYLTKDGALLIFPNAVIDIAKLKNMPKQVPEVEREEIPKADKPVIELFVMSLCPYGSRAEKVILPVIKPFGDKIDFKIKFIVNVNGNSINDVASLHGLDEVKEDARQAAIMKFYPDKFAAYIDKINEKSCVISCGAVKLEDYWKEAAGKLQMDAKKIEKFAYGQEGLSLLKENEVDSQKYNASASPTLIINGVKSDAIYKDATTIEGAI
ncbi:MAG: hypothetical protein M0R48_11685, partial [Candidatus Omnitrophica bacterium]|nr:hypothetical protein [Candidatus Omnitrophota bacterium]